MIDGQVTSTVTLLTGFPLLGPLKLPPLTNLCSLTEVLMQKRTWQESDTMHIDEMTTYIIYMSKCLTISFNV